jgi:transcriptional regulator with XRE-family HTH domain
VTVAQRFGRNLLCARRRAGLSQDELGFRADLHRTEVSQLERGLRLARIDTLAKLAGALGVEPGELMAGIGWQPREAIQGRFEAS